MKIDAVIQQLRSHAPIFNGNVAGAASYVQAKDQVWLPQPAAYVIPLEDEPGENTQQGGTGYYQVVREKIGVIIDLSNHEDPTDRRGQTPSTQAVDQFRAAIWAAILNWRPDPSVQSRGFVYAGGGLVPDGINRSWLRWQFDFAIETTISDQDGWQEPFEPLTEIRGSITNQTTGAESVELRAYPAQP
ncbi:phage tail terminator protein [Roseomonas chloroacetimidivorans]|uniref:phage tail terminator protein n=1 Tax=Roseomonas chloroacetimidivorans TaxID=1766656 RepID=UPI003C712AB4